MKVAIKAIEYFLPVRTEDGSVLAKDNPDWRMVDIEKKTGVRVRHISASGQTVVDMAVLAAEKLFLSGVRKEDIDSVILVTQSPDYALPPSACILQDRLGLKKSCVAFDMNLGCSGFVYGLSVAGSLIEAGLSKNGLLICSEAYSKYINKSNRTCRPIFSDGASAILLAPGEREILAFEMGTDGSGFSDLIVPNQGVQKGELFMDGAKLFMFTMDMVPKCVAALLEKAGKTINDVDLFVFHQASKLVIDNIIRKLDLPERKVFVNYHRVGNTVSASIPIALKDAVNEKCLKAGDLVMLVGFGVGYSWGGCLMQWEAK